MRRPVSVLFPGSARPVPAAVAEDHFKPLSAAIVHRLASR